MNNELAAQPTELVITLLRLSRLFDLTDEFETSLHLLDHLALNAYLPDDYRQFGAELIPVGRMPYFRSDTISGLFLN